LPGKIYMNNEFAPAFHSTKTGDVESRAFVFS